MRKFLFVLLLFPLFAQAQLDHLQPGMTESEFVSAFPNAVRNLDEESYWTGGADTIHDVIGNALWLIYNDTVSAFRFITPKIEGPSKAYPEFDSSAVHQMKLCLDKVRGELEKEFGKPASFRNVPLRSIGEAGVNRAYTALWKFPGNNAYIQLSISTDLSSGNFINAPGKFTVTESQSYEMKIEVTHRCDYTMLYYDLGKSSERFYNIYKNFRAPLLRDRIYTMSDSLVSDNAQWTVKFYSGKLESFSYSAYTGTGYKSKTDADAYAKMKMRATALLSEGETTIGKTDSLSNLMPQKYKPHDLQLIYTVNHLYSRWKTTQGSVTIAMDERGGGKNPDVIFHLEVIFNGKN
jgi:hypothetical protein